MRAHPVHHQALQWRFQQLINQQHFTPTCSHAACTQSRDEQFRQVNPLIQPSDARSSHFLSPLLTGGHTGHPERGCEPHAKPGPSGIPLGAVQEDKGWH
jgi:hypothetical protein